MKNKRKADQVFEDSIEDHAKRPRFWDWLAALSNPPPPYLAVIKAAVVHNSADRIAFLNLPVEIFEKILSHLRAYNFIGQNSLHLVCKRWHEKLKKVGEKEGKRSRDAFLNSARTDEDALNILKYKSLAQQLNWEEFSLVAGRCEQLAHHFLDCIEPTKIDTYFVQIVPLGYHHLSVAKRLLRLNPLPYIMGNSNCDRTNFWVALGQKHLSIAEFILNNFDDFSLSHHCLSKLGDHPMIALRILDDPKCLSRIGTGVAEKLGLQRIDIAKKVLGMLARNVFSATDERTKAHILVQFGLQFEEIALESIANPIAWDLINTHVITPGYNLSLAHLSIARITLANPALLKQSRYPEYVAAEIEIIASHLVLAQEFFQSQPEPRDIPYPLAVNQKWFAQVTLTSPEHYEKLTYEQLARIIKIHPTLTPWCGRT